MTSTLPPLAQAFSGALGSAVANVGSYPLDLAGTRLQTSRSKERQGIFAAFRILRSVVTSKGFLGLYDGLKTDTAATLLSNFFYYYAYSFLRSLFLRHQSKHTHIRKHTAVLVLEELSVGLLAGIGSRVISTPLSLITVRLQNEKQAHSELEDGEDDQEESDPTVSSIVKRIYGEQGLRGFWKGFKTTALLCLNPSLTLFLYQAFRRLFLRGRDRDQPSPRQAFIGAAFSNSIAIALLYPLILAKTRLQTSRSNSVMQVWRAAYRRNGISGLYQGLEAQLVKGFFNQGWTMMTKQRLEQLIISLYFYRLKMQSPVQGA